MTKKFVKFENSMCDKLYDSENASNILIKTVYGDIVHVGIGWEQGQGNNYYFYSGYFDSRVSISDVLEVELEVEDEETIEELCQKLYDKMHNESKPLPENFAKILSENIEKLF